MTGKEGDNRQSECPAHRVHLPGFVTDEDIGLGDVLKRMTYGACPSNAKVELRAQNIVSRSNNVYCV
jgi:hypothetical protein